MERIAVSFFIHTSITSPQEQTKINRNSNQHKDSTMKPTVIIQILALPVILAEYLELVIVAPADTYAIVAGKKDPGEAVVVMMNSTTPGFVQGPRCMDDDGNWKQDECDATRHKIYQQVGQLDFDGNNRYPRRFVIEVGPPCEEIHIWIVSCTMH
jgi:hypothetical protein